MQEGLINVTGKAQTTKAPDQARVHFSLKSKGQTAQIARNMTNTTAEVLKDAVKLNVGSVVERETRSEQPVYKYDHTVQNSEPEFLHYESVMYIQVKTNVEQLGLLLDTVLEKTENTMLGTTKTLCVDNITFDLSTKKQLENKLLGEAAQNAREKAVTIADALDLVLSEILEISESQNSYDYRFAPRSAMASMNERVGGSRVPTNIEPGLLTFEAQVNMKVSMSRPA